jgi:thiol-disulfide isomerase/thioredoxin
LLDLFMFLSRLLLAGVFAASGLAKLSARAGAVEAARAFGVPSRLAPHAVRAVIAAELILTPLLLIPATSAKASIVAAGLLLLFAAAMAVALLRRKRVQCHCFGNVGADKPIGWWSVARNIGLLAVAILNAAAADRAGRISDWAWMGVSRDLAAAGLVLAAVTLALVLGLATVCFQLMRQNGRLLLRVEALEAAPGVPVPQAQSATQPAGLPVGTQAPSFSGTGLRGETLTLQTYLSRGRPVLLTFTDVGCGPCGALMPDIARWQKELADQLTVAIVSRGDVAANRAKRAEHGLSEVVLQQNYELATEYRAFGTPSAVLVAADGRISSPLAQGPEAIRGLVATARNGVGPVLAGQTATAQVLLSQQRIGHPEAGAGMTLGDEVRDLTLLDLDGAPVPLHGPRENPAVFLFWNTGCGYCQRMLDDLRAWEIRRSSASPDLILIAAGSRETNAAQGLQSPILLDLSAAAARNFASPGTPSAVLVDRDGRIASSFAVGADAVLTLLAAEPAAV